MISNRYSLFEGLLFSSLRLVLGWGTWEATALVLDLLYFLLHNWGRVGPQGNLLPFWGGFVGRLYGCHKADKTRCHSRLKKLWC